ncbi:uncharacterized protein LTR77_003859 [Saxophila tyrrhenica]|uniref:Uncharacterized protein n=1 Tax=Saxophila tyrrhenica TaxID=1690608 RepID=A0AAV9PF21_9PEZI|nr:hypothetical protein LTR77_003859 [Saxophila tyrrhenica]
MADFKNTHSALHELQSGDQAELLDATDQLRKNAFNAEFDPTQIIVCGDQSSGKSSVLEAISRVRFPSKDTLCTKLAMELVLRRAPQSSFEVRIEPASDRTPEEKEELSQFAPGDDLNDLQHIPGVIEAATARLADIDLEGHGGHGFYKDKLVITIRRPDLPPLTLVDLPGFIQSSNRDQLPEDIDTVKQLAMSYMARENSIILAVAAANNNVANQIVFEEARQVDPERERTLGIITKPDLVDAGYSAEAEDVKFAQNRDIVVSMGWHVLKNCDPQHANATADERDALEAEFFSAASSFRWKDLPKSDLGGSSLREKLRKILLASIRTSLPTLVGRIENRVEECERSATKLGEPKLLESEQRQELTAIAGQLEKLVTAGIQGFHRESFRFEPLKLRASMRQLLDDFAQDMHSKGQRFAVASRRQRPTTSKLDLFTPSPVVDSTLSKALKCLIEIINDVFRHQTSKWARFANTYAKTTWHLAESFLKYALAHVAPSHTAEAISNGILETKLAASKSKLLLKVEELLKPYTRRAVFILNSAELQKRLGEAREVRREASWANGKDDPEQEKTGAQLGQAAIVLDYVNAQYAIALDTFLENFANLAIEGCLIEDLQELFTANVVAGMDASMVKQSTAEPDYVVRDREDNKQRLAILQGILKTCSKHVSRFDDFQGGRPPHASAPTPADPPEIVATSPLIAHPTEKTPSPKQQWLCRRSRADSGYASPRRISSSSSRGRAKGLAPGYNTAPGRSPSPLQKMLRPDAQYASFNGSEDEDRSEEVTSRGT